MRLSHRLLCSLLLLSCCAPVRAKGTTQHVVMMVWDGLRPDSVTQKNTPTLFRLAQSGVTFAHHHPVYPSSTEVNGTALATGAYPSHSGIVGNKEYRPDINPLKAISTEKLDVIQKGDAGGAYLGTATVAEILQKAGYRTAIAGTKPVTLLADRSSLRASDAARASVNIYEGETMPAAALQTVVRAQGAFPPIVEFPNTKEDTWTTDALTKVLWKQDVPRFSVLWLSDVDYSQHESAPGSPVSLAALKSCDDRLASVLAALQAKGVRDQTTIMVVSDHGFSTIDRNVDMNAVLKGAGFDAPKEFAVAPKTGQIMMAGLGGSVLFYVGGHDRDITRRLVEFLQNSDFAGVLFSRDALEGTFSLAQAHIDSAGAADVVMSFRWSARANAFGIPGSIFAEGKRVAGQGSHTTLSPYDMRNTLIVAGPDFKAGFVDQTPSGNTDLAPTILDLLGVASPNPMDGRVLTEALRVAPQKPLAVESGMWESTRISNGQRRHQYLQWSKVNGTVYLDEGNAGSPATP